MESPSDEPGFSEDDFGQEVDAAFVVGTGGLKECSAAWQPVLDAIHEVVPDLRDHCTRPAHANLFMAELIAVNRLVQASERRGEKTKSLVPERLRNIREQIASKLKTAVSAGSFSVQPRLIDQISSREWGTRQNVITTNWDTSLDVACRPYLDGSEILHVHGSVEQPDSLYLPSDHPCDAAHADDVRDNMLTLADRGIKALWDARHICIYGLSLDPLDAELTAILHTAFTRAKNSTALERIVIFDLASKEQELLERVRLLLQLGRSSDPRLWWVELADPPEIEFRAVG